MKLISFLTLIASLGGVCQGQRLCVDLTKAPASDDDIAALNRISKAVGFDPRTIFLYVSHEPEIGDRGGAISLVCPIGGGFERWIVYDPELIRSDVARDFVFAHEVAHHVNFQTMSDTRWDKQDELQADFNGSQYLLRMGWTKDRLLHALDLLGLPRDSARGYPSLQERRAEIEDAVDDYERSITPQPQPPSGLFGVAVTDQPPTYEENLKRFLSSTYQGTVVFQSTRTNKNVCAVGAPDPKIPSVADFSLFDNCAPDSRGFFDLQLSYDVKGSYWIRQQPPSCPLYAWNCLFAWEPGDHGLFFWNQDFGSYGYPGLQELFSFEPSDSAKGLFRIKSRRGGFVFVDPKTAKLESGGSQEQASEFKILFERNWIQ